jgi:hypothetical protein
VSNQQSAISIQQSALGNQLIQDQKHWLNAECRLLIAVRLLVAVRQELYAYPRYNLSMAVFNEKQEELEHFEMRMGVPRGRLAVTMDLVTDAMALVGQHGVYCQSQRWPGKPVMDVQLILKNLTDAKELIQSVMEELKPKA